MVAHVINGHRGNLAMVYRMAPVAADGVGAIVGSLELLGHTWDLARSGADAQTSFLCFIGRQP